MKNRKKIIFVYTFVGYVVFIIVATSLLPTPNWDKLLILLIVTWFFILSLLLTHFMRFPRLTVLLAWTTKIPAEKELDFFIYRSSIVGTTMLITILIALGVIGLIIAFFRETYIEYLLSGVTLGIGIYYVTIRKTIFDFFKSIIKKIRKMSGGSFSIESHQKGGFAGFNIKGTIVFLLILILVALLFWWGSSSIN